VAAMAEHSTEPVRTFSISFSDADYDESRYARMVAERYATEHHEFHVEPEAISIMPKLARHHGEPFADPAAIPTFHLAELAGRHVTVALNGDGGDETFGGYPRYVWPDAPAHLGWLPAPARRIAPAAGRLAGRPRRAGDRRDRIAHLGTDLAMGSAERYAGWVSAFAPAARRRLLTPEFAAALGGWRADDVITGAWAASPARDRTDRMLDTDVRTYLPGNGLAKTDIATMAYSVEGRSPFLDHEVMELAAAIPAELKVGPAGGKLILAEALRGVVPDAILDRPKMGFIVPLRRWLREELRELPRQILLDRNALDRGYFRRRELERVIREHREGTFDHSLRLWVLLQLETWHREIVDATPAAAAVPSL
jgi:asparagine synthase (glutamine-hydrolysing)